MTSLVLLCINLAIVIICLVIKEELSFVFWVNLGAVILNICTHMDTSYAV